MVTEEVVMQFTRTGLNASSPASWRAMAVVWGAVSARHLGNRSSKIHIVRTRSGNLTHHLRKWSGSVGRQPLKSVEDLAQAPHHQRWRQRLS